MENPNHSLATSELPKATVKRRRWPSPVWLLPLAAALIGVWLLVQYWIEQGNLIEVRFSNAEGIEAGSTQVRYKAVTVGRVKSVTLDENLEPVVTLALNKDMSDALECSAQFWVVRPRIRGAEISGLGTLFSGAYVGMLPSQPQEEGAEAKPALCYQALEGPPATRPNRPGREYSLVTDSMGSLDIGSPIFYKQLQVGEIINYRLSAITGRIELSIFIEEPYYRLINETTRFWDVSGIDFKMDSIGAEIRMESLTSLMIGGVAFDTPNDQNQNLPVSPARTSFELFSDYASSREKRYQDRLYYTLYFNGTLRGLAENAPVEFRGIRVGQVEKIKMHLDPISRDVRTPVLISLEPQRFSEELTLERAPKFMDDLVAKGMRARLQNGSLITGQMFVGLEFDPKATPETIQKGQFYAVFPTTATPVEELSKLAFDIGDDLKATLGGVRRFIESEQLDKTVTNVNKVLLETEKTMQDARKAVADARAVLQELEKSTLPSVTGNAQQVTESLTKSLTSITSNVDEVSSTLNKTLTQTSGNIDRVSGTVNRSLQQATQTADQLGKDVGRSSVELNKTMQRLQNSLTHLDRVLAQNSPTQYQLMEMMEEVTAMSRAVRALTDTLQRQPEAVIRGKKEWEDQR